MTEIDSYEKGLEGRNVAMLIDGDNAQPSLIDAMLDEASKYGQMTFRRIYGDWTTPQMGSWKHTLQTHAIQPVQQFRNIAGKNATDSALIIDAMDILHKEDVDIFVVVSSDSDFARLATRLREGGKMVIGIGRRQTPNTFVKACNIFVYTENLVPPELQDARKSIGKKKSTVSKKKAREDSDLRNLLLKALELIQSEDGSALLSQLGIALHKIDPGFDPRTYGKKKLLDLIEMYPIVFEVQKTPSGGPMSIRLKELK